MIAVFDTNILIDYLNGEVKAKNTIEQYDQIAISVITYIEIMVGVKDVHKKMLNILKKISKISLSPINWRTEKNDENCSYWRIRAYGSNHY